jgi:hypothetical protein
MIPREPAEGMDYDDIEGGRAARRHHVEQPLQLGTAVVRAARARLDKFNRDFPAASGAISERLPPLIGDRQVGFGLPAGGDAEV